MTLGQRISQYRKAMGISQEELGGRLGVSRQAVSKWETGAAVPDMENLLALSRTFGVPLTQLTQTPADGSADAADDAPSAPDLSPPPPRASAIAERAALPRWVIGAAACFLCLLALPVLFLWTQRAVIPAPSSPEAPLTEVAANTTDFALLWDGPNGREFLELGPQAQPFPFGTSLELTAPEDVADTDLRGVKLHRAVCGALTVEYLHSEGEAEVVSSLSSISRTVQTPRSIGPGSGEADLLVSYGDDLVYCLKEEGSYSLVRHTHFYAWSEYAEGFYTILFFIDQGKVAGIRMERIEDAGDAYAPDNVRRFPVRYGAPDFSQRREPEREDVDDTRKVYIAWNQLATNNNLTAEERYAYRRDLFALLPEVDWAELGRMGEAEADDTVFALMSALAGQEDYSASELLYLQLGAAARGIDGAYADAYAHVLFRAFCAQPVLFAKDLAADGVSQETMSAAIRLLAYDADLYPNELRPALATLEATLASDGFTEREAAWAALLDRYLTTPLEAHYLLPKVPAESR